MSNLSVSVADFGAVPGKEELQTTAFQKAIDHCFKAGGGEVVVPSGKYIIGDIRLRSNITLHLLENAKIYGSKNPNDYMNINNDDVEPLPNEQNTKLRWIISKEWEAMGGGFKKHLYTAGSYWNYGIIRASYAENISIIGEKGSEVNGQNVYDENGEEHYRGPHAINMHFCKNLKFSGYTVIDSGNWAHAIFQSENIIFENLTVLGGHDALHTRACDNVLMQNCRLITGDDCIAGFNNNDVVIRNCVMSSACSAFRYGGNNILIENCDVSGPCEYQFRGSFSDEEKITSAKISKKARNNMLCFYTNFVTDDLPAKRNTGNIIVRNCTVKNADRFFHLNLSGNEPWQRGNPPTDITFSNIKAENIKTGSYAYGNGEVPFKLTFENVNYSYCKGYEEEPFLKVAHFGEIKIENVKVTGYKGKAFIKTWTDGGEIHAEKLDCNIDENEFKVKADEAFECNAI